MSQCNVNFISKFAYLDNKVINIDNYSKSNNNKLKCSNGHELIPVLGKKNKHHFTNKINKNY